jgi:N-acetylmuramoyl-L-alanine amidase
MVNLEILTDLEVLSLTIIGEARGEPIESQVGVGSVVRNRLYGNQIRYKNYKDVVFEKLQFSCWNANDPNRPVLIELAEKMIHGQIVDIHLKQCIWVASGIVKWEIKDNTKGALHYIETGLFNDAMKRPSWARNAKNELVHGHHTFFNV